MLIREVFYKHPWQRVAHGSEAVPIRQYMLASLDLCEPCLPRFLRIALLAIAEATTLVRMIGHQVAGPCANNVRYSALNYHELVEELPGRVLAAITTRCASCPLGN